MSNNDLSELTGLFTLGTEVNIRSYNTSTGNLYEVPSDGYVHVYCPGTPGTDSIVIRIFGHSATSFSDSNLSEMVNPIKLNSIKFVKKGCKIGFTISGATDAITRFVPIVSV